jgi:hypothetical protein
MQEMPCAFCLALANAGNRRAAKMAMMAITTSSSMSVNARLDSAFISLQLSILHPSCAVFAEEVGGLAYFVVF